MTGPEHEVVPDDLPDPKREGARLTYYLRFKVDSPQRRGLQQPPPARPDELAHPPREARRPAPGQPRRPGHLHHHRREPLAPRVSRATARGSASRTCCREGCACSRAARAASAGPAAAPPAGRPSRPVKDIDGSAACLGQPELGARGAPGAALRAARPRRRRVAAADLPGRDRARHQAGALSQPRGAARGELVASELSNTGEALVEVEPDPDLDQGLLLGKVFCDRDGDGRQSRGERGLAGVRVYLDNGSYSVTDSTGKYHLRNINAGLHLVKLDTNTLPSGSRLTTERLAGRAVHPRPAGQGQLRRALPGELGRPAGGQAPPAGQAQGRAGRPQAAGARAQPGRRCAGAAAERRRPGGGRAGPRARAAGGGPASAGARRREVLELRSRAGRLAPPLVLDLRAEGPSLRGWTLSLWRIAPDGQRQLARRFSGSAQPPGPARSGTARWPASRCWRRARSSRRSSRRSASRARSAPRRAAASPSTGRGRRRRRRADCGPAGFRRRQSRSPSTPGRASCCVLGRSSTRPPLLELRRGDGKSSARAARRRDAAPRRRLAREGQGRRQSEDPLAARSTDGPPTPRCSTSGSRRRALPAAHRRWAARRGCRAQAELCTARCCGAGR